MSFKLLASLKQSRSVFVSSAPLSRLNSACLSSLRSPHYSRSSIDQTWRRGMKSWREGATSWLGERPKKRRDRVSARGVRGTRLASSFLSSSSSSRLFLSAPWPRLGERLVTDPHSPLSPLQYGFDDCIFI